jgi:hypothetical protein
VITAAVRWYLRYGLSYWDVEELLADRSVAVDHVTIYRRVRRFTPEFARELGAPIIMSDFFTMGFTRTPRCPRGAGTTACCRTATGPCTRWPTGSATTVSTGGC